MASFDIVSRIDLQEVDNAVNITKKTLQSRYDFRESKTEITLDKKDKKINVTTEDEMKMRAVQETPAALPVHARERLAPDDEPGSIMAQGGQQLG